MKHKNYGDMLEPRKFGIAVVVGLIASALIVLSIVGLYKIWTTGVL